MSTLRGLIFDLDGTLGNTVPICVEAFRRAAEPFAGKLYTDAEITATWGPSDEGSARVLAPGHEQECFESYIEWYEKLHDSCVEPFPGVNAMLDRLSERGILLGLVTGKGGRSCEISLRRMGLAKRFEDVEVGCPDRPCKPEAIGRILDRWCVHPSEVAYVGDAPSDVDSARKAGVLAFGAAWAATADPKRIQGRSPDALFLSPEALVEWVTRGVGSPA